MQITSVYNLLAALSSQDIKQLQLAEQSLKEAEQIKGFHATLITIYLHPLNSPIQAGNTHYVTNEIKFMAIRTLRANIERYWRRSNYLDMEEKTSIRSKAMDMLTLTQIEPKCLIQASLAIARIARIDYMSGNWNSLFEQISSLIQSPGFRDRGLLVLHHVIKALISVRIGPTRKSFSLIAPKLVHLCVSTFACCFQTPADPNLATTALYCIKCLRKLLAYAMDELDETCSQFLEFVPTALQNYYNAGNLPIVSNIGKLILQIQESRGLVWLTCSGTEQVVQWYIQIIRTASLSLNGHHTPNVPERIVLQSLRIVKFLVRSAQQFTFADHKSNALDDPSPALHKNSPPEAHAQFYALRQCLTKPNITCLVEVLVLAYMRPTQVEISALVDNPQQWLLDEDNDHWEYRVRGAASHLLKELVLTCGENVVVPKLIQFANQLPSGNLDMLSMVAIMSALSQSADHLAHHIPFIPLFSTVLVPWAHTARAMSTVEAALAGRCICIAMAAYVMNTTKESRPVLYKALAHEFLVSDQPLIVQVAAVDVVRKLVEDWELDATALLPYLSNLVDRLLQLLQSDLLSEFDLKAKVVSCLTVLIERLDLDMVTFAEPIAAKIPDLWSNADQEYMFQSTLLVMLKTLAVSLRAQSVQVHGIASALILQTCQCNNAQTEAYFLDDALMLWHTLVQFSDSLSLDLAKLMPLIPPLLETGSETLRIVMHIVQSYLFLNVEYTLAEIGNQVLVQILILLGTTTSSKPGSVPNLPTMGSFSSLAKRDFESCESDNADQQIEFRGPVVSGLGVMRPQASNVLTRVLETFLITGKVDALHLMVHAGIVHRLVQGVVIQHDQPVALVSFVSILARAVILTNAQTFIQTMLDNNQDTLNILVRYSLDLFDQISFPSHRKLNAIALAHLAPYVPETLPELINVWIDVLNEVNESNDGDCLLYWQMEASELGWLDCGNSLVGQNDILEMDRRKTVLQGDLVHSVSLVQCVKQVLELIASQYPHVLHSLDPDLISALEPLLH